MSLPHKALSALVCVVVAFVLGVVARLPTLMERMEPQVTGPFELNVTSVPARRATAWSNANPVAHP